MTPSSTSNGAAPRCPACGAELPEADAVCIECMETTVKEPAADFTGPRRIAGYRILGELGAGGMGTVFEAYEEKLGRRVALKVLSRAQSPSGTIARRFEQEAWIAGRLSHDNVVRVFDCGEWEDLRYFSMELLDGGSLGDVLGNLRRWGRDDRWSLQRGSREYTEWAIRQVIAAARGLEHAHRQGIVHRDVKPMNLLLSREAGCVKVADFGLAVDPGATRLTTAGNVLGTLAYMAPEQILGRQAEVSPRTDVYALGVTLFELLTLELPYSGPTQQMYMNAILTSAARRARPLNPRVGRDLETVLQKALEKDPRDRYATAGAIADDLENILHFRPIQAVPPTRLARVGKWMRRKPMHAALAVALLLGLPTVAWLGMRAVEGQRVERAAQVEALWDDVLVAARGERYRETVALTTSLLELDPSHVLARRTRAVSNMFLALGSTGDESAAYRERSLNDLSELTTRFPGEAWPLQLQAIVQKRLGLEKEAADSRARAEALPPRARDPFFSGLNALDAGEYQHAVDLFSEAHAAQGNRLDVLEYRARAYESLGEIDKARDDLRFAAALSPGSARVQYALGALLSRSVDPGEAEPHLRQAVRLDPDEALYWWALADNLLEQGRGATGDGDTTRALDRFRAAEKAARRAVEVAPDEAWSYVDLGAALLEEHRVQEAPDAGLLREGIASCERAFSLWKPGGGPDEAEALATARLDVCDALIQSGDLQKALASCRETAEQISTDPVAFYNLAAVHALLGQEDEALVALGRDVALGDDDADYLAADPWFTSLRDDPRFQALLARMRGDDR